MDPLNRFLETLNKYRMISRGDRILVSVSGGPDSVALLDLFLRVRRRFDLTLSVAHLNHRLRGRESDDDERFVRDLARRHRLPFHRRRLPAGALEGSGSIEARARTARHRFLDSTRRRTRTDRVAVGHQRDDQAETILLRLLRGSGRLGLGSIFPVWEGWLIRPLIEIRRRDLLDYLKTRRLAFREDRTNRDRRFLRNRIRHDLIPVLEGFNPDIVTVLAATADRLRDEDLILEGLAGPVPGAGAGPGTVRVLALEDLDRLPVALRRRRILAALGRDSGARHGIGSRHVDAVLDLADRNSSGRSVSLPGRLQAVRRPDRIEILPADALAPPAPFHRPLPVPGRCRLPQTGTALACRIVPRIRLGGTLRGDGPDRACLDAERIGAPLAVRSRRPGDRFRPLGAPGMKKLQDYFVDRKIAAELRAGWPLVVHGEDIVWVVGCQIDHRYRVRPQTRRVLVLECERGA